VGNIINLSFIQPGNPMLEPRSRPPQLRVQEKGCYSIVCLFAKLVMESGAFSRWPDIVLLNWHDYIHSLIEGGL